MTIHFKKEWLDKYQRNKEVNKIGARLGFAGDGYWTRAAIYDWLADQPEMKKCKAFYALLENRCSSIIEFLLK